MLSANLFRPIPKPPSVMVIEAPDSASDLAWPHVGLVYDAFLASFNCQQTVVPINATFVYHLIGNGSAPEERERVAVRGILYAIYAKFMNLRAMIREKVASQFTNGVCSGEILDFLVSVVSGYNSPLNPEHVTYFHRAVLPLHCLYHYPQFAAQLMQLVIRYVAKCGFLLEPALMYLLRHWPRGHRQKQALFLREIEGLLSNFEIHVTSQMAVNVCRLIGETTLNENTDVADTAISVVMNASLGFIVKAHAVRCFPLIIDPTYRAARKHWDDCIRSNAFVALQTLSEVDQGTFTKVKDGQQAVKSSQVAHASQVKANWAKVMEAAQNVDPSLKFASLDRLSVSPFP
jgi:serine/threonine-protein phosphatase 2A regulatory subunit B'